jgi:hypothetical protein
MITTGRYNEIVFAIVLVFLFKHAQEALNQLQQDTPYNGCSNILEYLDLSAFF